MAAVVPRFPAAKQRSEVSVKILKGPVHLLENRSIHFPASLAQAFPTTPSSYHTNCRCNIRIPADELSVDHAPNRIARAFQEESQCLLSSDNAT